jgi:Extensin-like protein C-terminus
MLPFRQTLPAAKPPASKAMRALVLLSGIGAFLSGCGFMVHEPREAWRAEAEIACMRSGIVQPSSIIRPTRPIDGPGPCGADLPLKVTAFQNDAQLLSYASTGSASSRFHASSAPERVLNITVIKPEVTMGCPMVAWTDDWISGSVQPAALAWFGVGVREIRTAGSYACRRRNHQRNARLSEHAFGNAIDVMSFELVDGRVVTIATSWRGSRQEQGFLRDVLHGACERFTTVLGPGSDALHYDHFHLDLARHDARGQRRYCKPRVEAPNRPLPGSFAAEPAGQPMPPMNAQIAPLPRFSQPMKGGMAGEGGEIEPNFDPSEFDLTSSIPNAAGPRLPPKAARKAPVPPVKSGYNPGPNGFN